jgi:small multidrug resistance pump
MSQSAFAILVTLLFSAIGVLGDSFLKLASEEAVPWRSGWFLVGFAVYASTAFGWVFVMQHLKLATIGVFYSVAMVVLLTTIGALFFGERISAVEALGIAMGIGSLVILSRFA